MSVLAAGIAPLLHFTAAPSGLAVGFSVLLVLTLVAAEEAELRRGRRAAG